MSDLNGAELEEPMEELLLPDTVTETDTIIMDELQLDDDAAAAAAMATAPIPASSHIDDAEVDAQLDALKEHITSIFHNDQVVHDIPLRVRMQNHGGWIQFSFLNHLKTPTFPNPRAWEKAILQMEELFEIKDKKFRRREMLPNCESLVYSKSVLFIPKEGATLDFNVVVSKIKDLIGAEGVFKGAYYRCIHPGEAVYPRDVSRLLHQCPTLRNVSFVWFELQQAKALNGAIATLNAKVESWTLEMSVHSLLYYMSQCKKSALAQQASSRKRGVTVSGDAVSFLSTSAGGGSNRNRNSASYSSRFQFPNLRSNHGEGELDWSQLRVSPRVFSPFGSNKHLATENNAAAVAASGAAAATTDSANQESHEKITSSKGGKSRLKEGNTSSSGVNNATTNNTSVGGDSAAAAVPSRKPRRRLAFSESESGPMQPLHKHATDGERPQFITRKNVPNCAEGGNQESACVTLIRQPRGPAAEGGFSLKAVEAN